MFAIICSFFFFWKALGKQNRTLSVLLPFPAVRSVTALPCGCEASPLQHHLGRTGRAAATFSLENLRDLDTAPLRLPVNEAQLFGKLPFRLGPLPKEQQVMWYLWRNGNTYSGRIRVLQGEPLYSPTPPNHWTCCFKRFRSSECPHLLSCLLVCPRSLPLSDACC